MGAGGHREIMSDLAEAEKEIRRLQYLKKEVDKSGDITKIAHFNAAATKAAEMHTRAKQKDMEERNNEQGRKTAELGAEFLIDRGKPDKRRFAPEDYLRYYYPETYRKSREGKRL